MRVSTEILHLDRTARMILAERWTSRPPSIAEHRTEIVFGPNTSLQDSRKMRRFSLAGPKSGRTDYSAGRRMAASLLIPSATYPIDMLPKLAGDWPNSRIDDLLPHNWCPSREDAE